MTFLVKDTVYSYPQKNVTCKHFTSMIPTSSQDVNVTSVCTGDTGNKQRLQRGKKTPKNNVEIFSQHVPKTDTPPAQHPQKPKTQPCHLHTCLDETLEICCDRLFWWLPLPICGQNGQGIGAMKRETANKIVWVLGRISPWLVSDW